MLSVLIVLCLSTRLKDYRSLSGLNDYKQFRYHRCKKNRYNRFLLIVAGLGGLLFGIDVGIIAGALPYLEATSGLNANQLSVVVAAVLLGSVLSTLFAGVIADWLGRKFLMVCSGILFVTSIPIIALSHGYSTLFFAFAGCTVVYFIAAKFFLPETKGKTLEEIEKYFEEGEN